MRPQLYKKYKQLRNWERLGMKKRFFLRKSIPTSYSYKLGSLGNIYKSNSTHTKPVIFKNIYLYMYVHLAIINQKKGGGIPNLKEKK